MRSHLLLFLLLASGLALQLPLSAQPALIDYYPPSVVPDRISLTLTATPAESIAVTWRTSLAVKAGYVQIALADPSPDFPTAAQEYKAQTNSFISDLNGAKYHSLTLAGLQPAQEYVYRVGDKVHWSEWNHFTTASAGKKELSFLYFGDAQNNIRSMWSRVVRGAYKKMPEVDFLLHAGDLINRANRDHEWGEWYEAAGWINRTTPSISTPGNHEYYRDENGDRALSRHWKTTFALPQNGPKGLEESTYFLDYEHVRIISLNTPAFLASETARDQQVAWLDSLLGQTTQEWTLVTMHHPVYSSKLGRQNPELQTYLQPLFEKYKVDLVLQGHDHTYSRGTNLPVGKNKKGLEGPIYVVSVSGPKMYDLGLEDWVQRAASNTQLYQVIKIKDQVLRFEAYMVTGELYDAFEIDKKKKGKTIFRDLAPDLMEERLELPPRFKKAYKEADWEAFKKRFEAYKKRKEE